MYPVVLNYTSSDRDLSTQDEVNNPKEVLVQSSRVLPMRWDLRLLAIKERGTATIVVIAPIIMVVFIVAVVVVLAFFRSFTHTGEETAKFLPADTDIYYSLNLRPGFSQLRKVRGMIERYTDNPDFQAKVDDLMDRLERESSVDLKEDVIPWLGPELAIGFINVVEIEHNPQVVVFIGTRDREAADEVLRRLIRYQQDEQGLQFREDTYKGFPTFSDEDEEAHLAVTDDYLLLATTETLLHNTIDMMEEPVNSLSENPRFREAQESVQEKRFSFLYVDVGSIVDQAIARGDGPATDLQQVRDTLPKMLAVSSTFIDKGIRIDASYETPAELDFLPPLNSIGSSGVIPDGSLALFSFTGLKGIVDETRSELEELVTFGLDVEEILSEFEEEVGIDFDQDVLGWMTGEVAVALLPSVFGFDLAQGSFGTVHLLAFFRFEERDEAQRGMDRIIDVIKKAEISFETVSIRGEEARLADLSEFLDETEYAPGFIILDDYVAVGSTRESLATAIDVQKGREPPLSGEPEFSRLLDLTPESRNSLLYLNIRGLVNSVVDGLSSEAKEDYQEEVAPFVEPLKVFLSTAETSEERTTFTLVLTIE